MLTVVLGKNISVPLSIDLPPLSIMFLTFVALT